MLVTLAGIVTLAKEVQPRNANNSMLVTRARISTLVKEVQSANAHDPMLVTPAGITMLVKEVQSSNAPSSMLVTLAGIVTLVKEVQPENACLSMLVTLPSVGITLSLHPATNVLLAVSIKQFPATWYAGFPASTAMLSKEMKPANAPNPMLVTLAGIVTLVKEVQ